MNASRFGASDMASASLAYPLFFVLEWLVLQLGPEAVPVEFLLRFVPALAGTLAVAFLFLAPRGLLDRRTRHLVAACAAFSPWLLYHSQFARFYSLLLLLSALASFAFLYAVRFSSIRAMCLAAACFLLGMATHPTAALLLLGHVCAFFAIHLTVEEKPLRLLQPIVVIVALPLLAAVLGWEIVQETLIHRLQLQDSGADSITDLVQGIAYNYGITLSMLSAVGLLYLLPRSREMFLHVLVGVGVPFAAVFGLALFGTAVEQRYLIPVVPLMLLPAGRLMAAIVEQAERRIRLARFALPALMICPSAPALFSHYVDGNRHDLEGAAETIRSDLRPTDLVISENHFLLHYYLPELSEELLIEAPPHGVDSVRYTQLVRPPSRTGGEPPRAPRYWIVVPAEFRDLRGDRADFYQWCWEEGQLVRELYRPRYDYHQNRLQVFLVDATETRRWLPERNFKRPPGGEGPADPDE